MKGSITIAGRRVGPGLPCFIVAEAGVNHNGRLALARRLVDAAARAGADAVKFQMFRADRLASDTAPTAPYQRRATGAVSQREMLRRLELSGEAHRSLAAHCRRRGILFLSTPFDEASADFLERLGVAAFKISSGDLTNLPFLEHLASKGRPLILSTGMATLAEVREAVAAVRRSGNPPLALLHCVSVYPAVPADVNLRAMEELRRAFGGPVGYSDHTLGLPVALAAAARGASILEKHFTLDRSLKGPDHRMSLEPEELGDLVRGIRSVEEALSGDGRKAPAPAEAPVAAVARKSLAAARDISPGERFSRDMVVALRPGTGLSPALLPRVLGRRAARAVPAGALIRREWIR